MKKWIVLILLSAASGLATGCGNKGPLTPPPETSILTTETVKQDDRADAPPVYRPPFAA